MSTEYNFKLIANLHEAKKKQEIIQILEEMEEIGDPGFAYSIWVVYKRYKSDTFSHYFISALGTLDSEEATGFLKEIALDPTLLDKDVQWAIHGLGQRGYYRPDIVAVAIYQLEKLIDERKKEGYSDLTFDVDYMITYLSSAKALDGCQDILQDIFTRDEFSNNTRRFALGRWIRINTKQNIKFFIDNFENIKNKKIEIVLAKEIINWNGPLSNNLKRLIIETGGSRAKEIIKSAQREEEKQNKKEKQKEKQKETFIYGNVKLVREIADIRQKINSIARDSLQVEFDLFPETELLIKQTEVARDEKSLRNVSIDLRCIIAETATETLDHSIDNGTALKIIKGTKPEDLNKPINRLILYLRSKKVDVQNDLFGLRLVHSAVSLFGAHPEAKSSINKVFKELDLTEKYKEENWQILHECFLKLYKESLGKLKTALIKAKTR